MLKKYSNYSIDCTLPTVVEFRKVDSNNGDHIVYTQNISIRDASPNYIPDWTEVYRQIDILKQYIKTNFPHIEII